MSFYEFYKHVKYKLYINLGKEKDARDCWNGNTKGYF